MRKNLKSVTLAVTLMVATQLTACSLTVNHSSNSSPAAATAAAVTTPTPTPTATPTPTPGSLFSGGTGTAGDPYLIANAADLEQLNTKITSDYNNFKDKYYKQTANIDFGSNAVAYLPIGPLDNQPDLNDFAAVFGTAPTTKPFAGTYDGNNFKLQNLKFTGSSVAYSIGVFRAITAGGVVKNLIIEDPTVLVTGAIGGMVTPFSQGQIDHVTVTGLTVTTSQLFIFGGIAGIQSGGVGISYASVGGSFAGSTVNVCAPGCTENNADVGSIGGITAWLINLSAGSTPTLSHVSSSLNITAGGEAAGITSAALGQFAIDHATNSGNIISHERAAGIANMTATGEIGGVNGLNKPTMSHLANTGNITVTGTSGFWPIVSGLVNQFGGIMTDSYNTGMITHSHSVSGSLAGLVNIPFLYAELHRDYSSGTILSVGASNSTATGGLIGQISDSGYTFIMTDTFTTDLMIIENSNGQVASFVSTLWHPTTGDVVDIERCYAANTIIGGNINNNYTPVLISDLNIASGQVPSITFQNLYFASDAFGALPGIAGVGWADYVTNGGVDQSNNWVGLSNSNMHVQGSFSGFTFPATWTAPDATHYPTLNGVGTASVTFPSGYNGKFTRAMVYQDLTPVGAGPMCGQMYYNFDGTSLTWGSKFWVATAGDIIGGSCTPANYNDGNIDTLMVQTFKLVSSANSVDAVSNPQVVMTMIPQTATMTPLSAAGTTMLGNMQFCGSSSFTNGSAMSFIGLPASLSPYCAGSFSTTDTVVSGFKVSGAVLKVWTASSCQNGDADCNGGFMRASDASGIAQAFLASDDFNQ